VTAERACLEVLDGSCRTPIAALAEHEPGGILRLRALIALPDGSAMHAPSGGPRAPRRWTWAVPWAKLCAPRPAPLST
jgi:Porphobilinogen deaminase